MILMKDLIYEIAWGNSQAEESKFRLNGAQWTLPVILWVSQDVFPKQTSKLMKVQGHWLKCQQERNVFYTSL